MVNNKHKTNHVDSVWYILFGISFSAYLFRHIFFGVSSSVYPIRCKYSVWVFGVLMFSVILVSPLHFTMVTSLQGKKPHTPHTIYYLKK